MNQAAKKRFVLATLMLATLVWLTACGTGIEKPTTDLSRFEQAGMLEQGDLDSALAAGDIGAEPDKAVTPLFFAHDGNLLNAESFNRLVDEGKLEQSVSKVTYTDFTTFQKVMQEKVSLGLTSQAAMDNVNLKYVTGMTGFAVKGVDMQTQLESEAINRSVYVYDAYSKFYYTEEDVAKELEQMQLEGPVEPPFSPASMEDSFSPDLSSPSNSERDTNLDSVNTRVIKCAHNVTVGDVIVSTAFFAGITNKSFTGHSGLVSWTDTGHLSKGNGCDSGLQTIEAVGPKWDNTLEVDERPASVAFNPTSLPKGKKLYYARYHVPRKSGESRSAWSKRWWDSKRALREYHRKVDRRNDSGKVTYDIFPRGRSMNPDVYTQPPGSGSRANIYCSLLNWMAHKKVYNIDIDANGGLFVVPLDLVKQGSPLKVYFVADNE